MIKKLVLLLAAAAAACLLPGSQASLAEGRGRQTLQAAQVPTNCTAPGDSWTRSNFHCSVPPVYIVSCALSTPPAPAGTVQCQVVNTEKPNIQTAMTCPVTSCTAVCDLVVMQNFFPADLVFATTELLAAWKPAAPGC